jgi:hypothetical protein
MENISMQLKAKILDLFNLRPRHEDSKVIIKFARYTTDKFLILGTNIGQFTFDVIDCKFSVNSNNEILFIFSRKNENGREENLDLKVDNSLKYKEINNKIIEKFNDIKAQKITSSYLKKKWINYKYKNRKSYIEIKA